LSQLVTRDYDTIQDRATFDQPAPSSIGIDWVMVNGAIVMNHNQHTGGTPGKVMRP